MATLEECQEAVDGLVARLSEVDPDVRRRYAVERTVSCKVSDLGVVFLASFADDGMISEVHTADEGRAQVALTVSSDDLIALIEGRLGLPTAWATGRLRIDASMLDLLKLRALL